jgi:hypothetical protein
MPEVTVLARECFRGSSMPILRGRVLRCWLPLGCIILVAFGLLTAGVKRDLPFTPESDEHQFVHRAVNIAATADLNPHWFGNPGSTLIYPLAGIYRVQHAAVGGDAGLRAAFKSDPEDFYLMGRFLVIFYAVAAIPFVYMVGRRAFGERVALIGAALSSLYPLAVSHAQMVRSDNIAVLFGTLALWLCLRVYDRPTVLNQLWAGLAIGLAISTRYFMVALLPVLLAANILALRRDVAQGRAIVAASLTAGAGLVMVAVTFAATTPFFFLDFKEAWASVSIEARDTHLGHDGLSPPENALWYLRVAIPSVITWPQAALMAVGVGLVLLRRRPEQLLLLGFAVIFLAGISLSGLHWKRWIIPMLPVLTLLAAYAIVEVAGWLAGRLRASMVPQLAVVLAAVAVAAWPGHQVVLQDIRHARDSTRILAREWILENVPAGSRLAEEEYTAPSLAEAHLDIFGSFSLAGRSLDEYQHEGYKYLVVSSSIYGRYLAEPERYVREVAFYRELFTEVNLLQRFVPSSTRGGPEIRIYGLDSAETTALSGAEPPD